METKTAIGISITHELLTAIDRRVAELRVKDPTLRMNRSSFVRAAVRKALSTEAVQPVAPGHEPEAK